MVILAGCHEFPSHGGPCYSAAMLHCPAIAGLQSHEVTAISRQCELLILCARIGFNP
jgi:hypothetical protein